MNSEQNKINQFLGKQNGFKPNTIPGQNEDEEIMLPKDGLYERREIINKRLMTKDGKQLLKEQTYEA